MKLWFDRSISKIDLNATQAAIRAGYSEKTAEQMGYQLLQKTSVQAAIQEAMKNLTKPHIKTAIDKAIAERSRRTGINQDRVLLELTKIAFLNPTKDRLSFRF